MQMKLVIAVHHHFHLWIPPKSFADRIRRDFPELDVVQLDGYDGLKTEIVDADLMIAFSMRAEQFKAARRLKWIHSTAAAVHALLLPEVVASEVVVTNARDVHGPAVAEHVMGMVWTVGRQLHRVRDFQHKHVWAQELLWDQVPHPREMRGSTMLVVGFGAIGRPVAQMAHAAGMRVIAVREHPDRPSEPAQQVFGFDELDEALPLADFVVVAAPVTEKTTGLFNEERLRKMKRGACLFNVGRGIQVDSAALARVIREGHLAGAGLDVVEKEPLPPDSPLWDVPEILITPHVAGFDDLLWERQYELYSENLRRYFAGEPLLGLVDKQKGY
jgi:phosphoglycerate dehydrogenase-like enzyme